MVFVGWRDYICTDNCITIEKKKIACTLWIREVIRMAITGNLIDEYKNLISGTFLTEEDLNTASSGGISFTETSSTSVVSDVQNLGINEGVRLTHTFSSAYTYAASLTIPSNAVILIIKMPSNSGDFTIGSVTNGFSYLGDFWARNIGIYNFYTYNIYLYPYVMACNLEYNSSSGAYNVANIGFCLTTFFYIMRIG